MPLKLTKFKAAAISAPPVYLNREATVQKVCSLIEEGASNGARLIAFPETFVPGYPHWYHVLRVDHRTRRAERSDGPERGRRQDMVRTAGGTCELEKRSQLPCDLQAGRP